MPPAAPRRTLGALVFTAAAGSFNIGEDVLPWIVAAFVLYAVTFVITVAINVPLNDEIKMAGDPDRIPDLAAGARAVQRVAMGPVESRPRARFDDRVRLPRVGTRRARRFDVSQTPRTVGGRRTLRT